MDRCDLQMGKFYEMFEMDAHIGAKELDLQYMKVCILLITLFFCIVGFDGMVKMLLCQT